MATSRVTVDYRKYVRINEGYGKLIIESLKGAAHVVMSENQPVYENTVFQN